MIFFASGYKVYQNRYTKVTTEFSGPTMRDARLGCWQFLLTFDGAPKIGELEVLAHYTPLPNVLIEIEWRERDVGV